MTSYAERCAERCEREWEESLGSYDAEALADERWMDRYARDLDPRCVDLAPADLYALQVQERYESLDQALCPDPAPDSQPELGEDFEAWRRAFPALPWYACVFCGWPEEPRDSYEGQDWPRCPGCGSS